MASLKTWKSAEFFYIKVSVKKKERGREHDGEW